MTEQEQRIFRITRQCLLEGDFCDQCELGGSDYEECRKTHEALFAIAHEAIEQRSALLADLNMVCGGKFMDICCVCGHYTPEHPSDKCELKGLDCRWIWRGVQKGGTKNVCTDKE